MRKLIVAMVVVFVLAGTAGAATLDRGVSVSSMFVAGGAGNGYPGIVQLKYQMAIDSFMGILERYTTNVYQSYYSYESITTNVDSSTTADTVIDFDADVEGYIMLTTDPTTYEHGSNPTVIDFNASVGEGQIVLTTDPTTYQSGSSSSSATVDVTANVSGNGQVAMSVQ